MKPYFNVISPGFLDFMGHFSPLGVGGIGNMTIAPLIISREPLDETSEAHEALHIYQTYEVAGLFSLFFIPFLLLVGVPWWGALIALILGFSPVGWFNITYGLLAAYWNIAVIKNRDSILVKDRNDNVRPLTKGEKGYFLIPFEREAYLFDQDGMAYLENRKFFAWARIAKLEDEKPGDPEIPERLFDAYEDYHAFGVLFSKRRDDED